MLYGNDGLQTDRGGPRFNRSCLLCASSTALEEAAKHPVPAGKFVRVAASTKACSDYRVVAAWFGFLTFIGTGAFVLGMAIHNEAIARQQPPRPERIWLRAEVDMPEQALPPVDART